jgi:hypothetical protein
MSLITLPETRKLSATQLPWLRLMDSELNFGGWFWDKINLLNDHFGLRDHRYFSGQLAGVHDPLSCETL